MGLERSTGSLDAWISYVNQLTKHTHFRSANISRSNKPPSSGKFVLNTPFFEAGVPASRETRRIYGR